MDKTAELLFEYLKNILYHPSRAHLDSAAFPQEFQKLVQGLLLLNDYIQEEQRFVKALAKGDLSLTSPDADNILIAPLKELQASLRHLTWQTQQIAKGDYSQHVDFMGDFSDSFNTMTAQLSERTAKLLEEKKLIEKKNEELNFTLNLILTLANYTHSMIFVFSETSGGLIFSNQSAECFIKAHPKQALQMQTLLKGHCIDTKGSTENWEITIVSTDENEEMYYDAESFRICLADKQVIVHIITDDTERTKRELNIYRLSYIDPLTGLNNRRYAIELAQKWINEGTPFLLSFIDVDYLKYCNDTFGHDSGDRYLLDISNALKIIHGELCRIGGDEFLLLSPGTSIEEQDKQLSGLRSFLLSQADIPYPQSFSFATCKVPIHPTLTLEQYINEADAKMYDYKLKNKKKLSDIVHQDDRIG